MELKKKTFPEEMTQISKVAQAARSLQKRVTTRQKREMSMGVETSQRMSLPLRKMKFI